MARQVSFSQHEAVLLLDAYLNSVATGQPRAQAVKKASEALRKMAINRGIEIDDVYRNVNGIGFQMARMESAYAGRTIHQLPATKLFTQTVALFRENRGEYDKFLREARLMVDGRNRTEELFAAWLAENVPSARLSEVYIYCSEIESYCQKIKVLRRPLFETTDMDTVRLVQKTVAESRLFQLSHKGQMKKIVAAAQYYATFVKTLSAEAESATILPPPEKIIAI